MYARCVECVFMHKSNVLKRHIPAKIASPWLVGCSFAQSTHTFSCMFLKWVTHRWRSRRSPQRSSWAMLNSISIRNGLLIQITHIKHKMFCGYLVVFCGTERNLTGPNHNNKCVTDLCNPRYSCIQLNWYLYYSFRDFFIWVNKAD